ncbi:MAG: carboxylesterase/lipase family protein [Desulfobacteraceae bacterium]
MEYIVNTKQGKLQGSKENNLFVFRGIPFTEPPVGNLRWMPPQPFPAWEGVRPALKYGTIAPQKMMPAGGPIAVGTSETQSEDCLYLNVCSSGLDDKKRPVMVWIHGGAFSIGSGSEAMFRSGSIAERGDVVLVTTNYRLGALGFLNLDKVTGGKIPSTGNEGLLDQVAALEWVRDNIAGFGGDPDNVTIFGESAGGMSVASLMVLPRARGLFHKAIIESAVGAIGRPLENSIYTAETFLNIAGISADDVDGLMNMPPKKILEVQAKVALETDQGEAPCIPVADGKIMPLMPLEAFSKGKAARVPTMIGTNLDEQKLFSFMNPLHMKMGDQYLVKLLTRNVPEENIPMIIDVYKKEKEKRGESVRPLDLYSAINTDIMFRNIALHIIGAQLGHGISAYNYLFTWKSPALGGALGAAHALEVGFVFGTMDDVFCGQGPAVDKLSGQMQDAWTAFARTGNPSCDSLGEWPEYGTERKTMIISENCHVEDAAYEEERKIWEKVGPVDINRML